MHSLINSEIVETIRETGKTDRNFPDRKEILEANGLPYDRKADNVVVTGCQILSSLPHVLAAMARIFDRGGLSYTFLSTEYCCGNNIYRPAIKAKDEDALSECRSLSKEFVELNIRQAKELGAGRLIIFCSPCYPIYKHAFPDENIIFYPEAINETVDSLEFKGEIDYYAGCYRLHRKFAPVSMDLESTNDVLQKIDSLNVNRISSPACCYKPEGLNHMISSIKTDKMVHICTGCYFQALLNMPGDKKVNVLMLPEFVEMTAGL
ncbi:MAG: hypothetical protein JRI61_00120 [Deltaproteobacteria bacterium]|nr:hypothetical protein [Deltaproteobacteria bacterium]